MKRHSQPKHTPRLNPLVIITIVLVSTVLIAQRTQNTAPTISESQAANWTQLSRSFWPQLKSISWPQLLSYYKNILNQIEDGAPNLPDKASAKSICLSYCSENVSSDAAYCSDCCDDGVCRTRTSPQPTRPVTDVPHQPPTESPTPTAFQAQWLRFDNTSAFMDYGGSNPNHKNLPFWDIYRNTGLYNGSLHACRTDINYGCRLITRFTNKYSQVRFRLATGFNASSADVYIDGQRIGEADANKGTHGIGPNVHLITWTSNQFTCGVHELRIVPNGRTGRNAKSFPLDYLEVQTCE